MKRACFVFVLIVLVGIAAAVEAADTLQGRRPVVGIALSGGGAKGIAHIGVLKVLEEVGVPVDVVAGTSMGSIVGALYAVGYSASDLERIVLEIDWDGILSDRLDRSRLTMKNRKKEDRYLLSLPVTRGRVKLPAGLIHGHKIYNLFIRLTWPALEIDDFRKLPRPFSCVAVDIASGDPVVLDGGFLPDAIRTSMAIPSVFTPVWRDGKLLVDGGLIRNLPAEDASNLGADIVIGVDVASGLLRADEIENLVDILNQSVSLAGAKEYERQKALCDMLISPDLEGFATLDFSKTQELIRRGEEAARRHLDELRALADSLGRGRGAPPVATPEFKPIRIEEIEVRGLRDVSPRLVLAELGFTAPGLVTAENLEQAIERLYSTGFFADLSYRFEGVPAGRKLVIVVRENSGILLNTGLGYDSYWSVSLLLNASLRNIFGHGSQFEFDLLIGERLRFRTEYAIHTGVRSGVGIRVDLDYIDDYVNVYEAGRRISRWTGESTRGGIFIESLISNLLYAAVGANMEWFELSPSIAPPTAARITERCAFLSGELRFDTLDRSWFPRRGIEVRARGEVAGSVLGTEYAFERFLLQWRVYLPLHPRLTLGADMCFGVSTDEMPLHYNFFLGGMNSYVAFQGDRTSSFPGYEHQELSGPDAGSAGLVLQVEPIRKWYLILAGKVGSATEERKDILTESELFGGGAVGIGVETPAGPISASITYSRRNDFGYFVSAGFPF